MTDKDEQIRKIRALLAVHRSAKEIGSEEESQAFAAKVQDLLARYKLSLSDVDYEELKTAEPIIEKDVDFESAGLPIKKARVQWQEVLAYIVSNSYFCRSLIRTGSSRIYLVGKKDDVETAEQVFLYLARVASNLAEKEYVAYFHKMRKQGRVEAARGYRSSYLRGFCNRLFERFEEEKEKLQVEWAANQKALIRLTDALVIVDEHIKDYKKDKRAEPKPISNRVGYLHGTKAADATPIGQNTRQIGNVR
jgi:hypothetical protein